MKFRDNEKLGAAYLSLEKEFTRKCQALAEAKKEIERLTDLLVRPSEANAVNENASAEETSGTSVDAPPQKEDFFTKYRSAPYFESALYDRVSAPENAGELVLKDALLEILDERFVPLEVLAADENFLKEFVMKSKDAVNVILREVFVGNAPSVIAGSGGEMSLTPPVRPKTLHEASWLAKEYFKGR